MVAKLYEHYLSNVAKSDLKMSIKSDHKIVIQMLHSVFQVAQVINYKHKNAMGKQYKHCHGKLS